MVHRRRAQRALFPELHLFSLYEALAIGTTNELAGSPLPGVIVQRVVCVCGHFIHVGKKSGCV